MERASEQNARLALSCLLIMRGCVDPIEAVRVTWLEAGLNWWVASCVPSCRLILQCSRKTVA